MTVKVEVERQQIEREVFVYFTCIVPLHKNVVLVDCNVIKSPLD